jgi:hypothetical protein
MEKKFEKFGNKVAVLKNKAVVLKDKVVPVAKVTGVLVGTYVVAYVTAIGVGTILGGLLSSGNDVSESPIFDEDVEED